MTMQQREILFRAKRNEGKEFDGQWVEGFCGYADNLDVEINVVLRDWAAEESVCLFDTIVCDRDTLGQYTGLQDVNGVKIFEGDILRVEHDGNIGESFVVWGYDGWKLNSWTPLSAYPFFHQVDFSQVIGNIHDNPELINQ